MKYQQLASVAAIIALVYLLMTLAIAARAQDDPICVPDQPCIGPAVTAIATPSATPILSPTFVPTPTPVVVRPMPLSPCKISPGCALLPIVRTP